MRGAGGAHANGRRPRDHEPTRRLSPGYRDHSLQAQSAASRSAGAERTQLARDMCEVLYHELGVGLAAPQLGEDVRLIVVDTERKEGVKRAHGRGL